MKTRMTKPESAGAIGNVPSLRAGRFSHRRSLRRELSLLLLLAAGMAFSTASMLAASPKTADDRSREDSWLQNDLFADGANLPFSFAYGGHASADLLKSWTRTSEVKHLNAGFDQRIIWWSDTQTGLQVRAELHTFPNSPVVEWTLYFKNISQSDTPILEAVHPLDLSVPVAGKAIPTILYSQGAGTDFSTGGGDYSLQRKPMNQMDSFSLSNESGGKTGNSIPFFDVVTAGRGLIGALGWAGRWQISFSRPVEGAINISPGQVSFSKPGEDAIHVSAGMEKMRLLLHPGEEIRTPAILLLPWQGEDLDAHNVLRRHILAFHTPHYDGQPVVVPISHLGWGGMKNSTSLHLIDQISAKKLGFEDFWMDAGWYGKDRPVDEFQTIGGKEDWGVYTGDWRVNQVPHPGGLRSISDAAHAKGMKYLLWFEPERPVAGTPLTVQHPEWFIGKMTAGESVLFNFGNPAARKFMTDWISEMITQQGIDIYRNDCNFSPAVFWDQADEPSRQGMTEIRYVEGLLQFWDDLRIRHPGLILDVVERTDLDTISRAVDLSRADYPAIPDSDPIEAQVSTEGLAYWQPDFGTLLELRPNDTYSFRSSLAPGLGFAEFNIVGTPEQVGKFIPADFPFEWMRTMIAQLKRARPYYYGDYYPILPCSVNSDCDQNPNLERSASFEWAAWQMNRPERGGGMVQAFRREKNDQPSMNLILHGLDPTASYQVTDVDTAKPIVVSGKSLMNSGLRVEIPEPRGAVILFYQKIQ